MTSRRRFTATLLASTVVAAAPSAWAANEPPIHVLVGFPAGGGADALARLLAEREPIYRAVADFTVANDATFAACARKVLEGFDEAFRD